MGVNYTLVTNGLASSDLILKLCLKKYIVIVEKSAKKILLFLTSVRLLL